MSGKDPGTAAGCGEKDAEAAKSEKREGSPAVDDIAAKLNACIEKKNKETVRGGDNQTDRKSKEWNLCWDFQSKSGCRKGAKCKWIHNAITNSHPVSHEKKSQWKPNYRGSAGRGHGFGGLGQQSGMGAQWLPPYASMPAEGLKFSPNASKSALDMVAKRFSPNVAAEEFSPRKKALSPGSTTYRKNLKVEEFSQTGVKDVFAWASKNGKNVQAEEFSPGMKGGYSLGPVKYARGRSEKGVNESHSGNRGIKKSMMKNSQDIYQEKQMRARSQHSSDSKIPRSQVQKVRRANPSRTNEVAQFNLPHLTEGTILGTHELNGPHPSFRASRSAPKSYSHWADVCSPIGTPLFKKLPMPRLKNDKAALKAQGFAQLINSGGVNMGRTSKFKGDPQQMIGMGSPNWNKCFESLKQMHQQMKNSNTTVRAGKGPEPLMPFPKSFTQHSPRHPDVNIANAFHLHAGKSRGHSNVNMSNNSLQHNIVKNNSSSMNGDIRATNMMRAAEALLKSQSARSAESGFQNCFDMRNMESPKDFGPITKNNTKEGTSVSQNAFYTPGYSGGLIQDRDLIPTPKPNSLGRSAKTLAENSGALEDAKNSKMAALATKNTPPATVKTGTQVATLPIKTPSLSSSRVFSPPLEVPEILPQENPRRTYGSRGRGKSARGYPIRMNSWPGRGRGAKADLESYGESQIQNKLSRFPTRGEHMFRGKQTNDTRRGTSRGRRFRGVGRGGRPRVFSG